MGITKKVHTKRVPSVLEYISARASQLMRFDGRSRTGDLRTFPRLIGNVDHEGGKAKCIDTHSKPLCSALR